MDIIYMDGKKEDNDGFKFILSIIDCWSKFAFVFPLRKIQSATVVECLRQLFSKPENIPEKVSTDIGAGKLVS